MTEPVRWISVAEAARRLSLSPQRVRELIRDGKIPAVKTGPGRTSHLRVTEQAVAAELARRAPSQAIPTAPMTSSSRHRVIVSPLPGAGSGGQQWRENEGGPECSCGAPTVVKLLPDGAAILMCLFHAGEAGVYTRLPAERPDGWPA